MIFRPVRPGIPHRPTEHELPGRVDVDEVSLLEALLVVQAARQDGPDHALDQIWLDQRLGVDPVRVLGGDQDALDLDRALDAVLVLLVADGHLRLSVRTQVEQLVGLAHLGQPLAELVRERDRERHQLLGLAACVPEHHPLVARAQPVERIVVAGVVLHLVGDVDALGDVRRLLVDRDDDGARVRVEAEVGARVADLGDLLADELRDVDVRLGGDLAGDDHEARRDERLAGDAAVGIVLQDGVEDRVGDLVGDLVGVPLGHRLGREEVLALGHTAGKATYWIPRNPVSVRSPPSFDPYRSRPRSGAVFSLATCGTVAAEPLRVRERVLERFLGIGVDEAARLLGHPRLDHSRLVRGVVGQLRPAPLHLLEHGAAVRRHELPVEDGGVDRHPGDVDFLRLDRADLDRADVQASARRGQGGQAVEDARCLRLVADLGDEEDRRRSALVRVEGDRTLAVEEPEDVLERIAEDELDLRAVSVEVRDRVAERVDQLVDAIADAVEREVDDRAAGQRTRKVGVVAPAEVEVSAEGRGDLDPVGLGRDRRGQRVERADLALGRTGREAGGAKVPVERSLDGASARPAPWRSNRRAASPTRR